MRDIKDLELKSKVPGADKLNWSQKWAKTVRPQKPADATMGGENWQPGQMPVGGFRSIYNMTGTTSTKISSTSGGGKKVY